MEHDFRGIPGVYGLWYLYSAMRTVPYFVIVDPIVPRCLLSRKFGTDGTAPDEYGTYAAE